MNTKKNAPFQFPEDAAAPRTTFLRQFEGERPGLFRYACYKLGSAAEAEDALQDVFVKFWTNNRLLRSVDDWRSYLYRTLANHCIDRLRRSETCATVSLDACSGQWPDEADTDAFEKNVRPVRALLAAIPPEQAEVIRLRLYADLGFAEIARIVGCPVTTIQSRFVYGLEKLRKELNQTK